jgi:drug/metabolite transporter (DMT)-like permease
VSVVPLWFVLALLCALSWSAADAFSKAALREHSPGTVMWVRWGYALPLLALAASMRPVPSVDPGFWAVLAAGVPLEIAAGLLYLHALKVSPMSLALPFLAWTPVFTAMISLAVLGEIPGLSGAAGIGLVAAGSFLLAWEGKGGAAGLFHSFRREKGVLCILAVALIYSLTSALGKLGVGYSSPSFFGFTYALSVTAAYTVLLAWRRRGGLLSSLRPNRSFLAVGAAAGLMIVFHFAAIELTQVAYMISVKRSSLLFSVLLGRLFFGERQTGRRFLGTAVMCAGMLLIVAED